MKWFDEAVDVLAPSVLLHGGPAVGATAEQLLPVVLVVHGAVGLGVTVLLRQTDRDGEREMPERE